MIVDLISFGSDSIYVIGGGGGVFSGKVLRLKLLVVICF